MNSNPLITIIVNEVHQTICADRPTIICTLLHLMATHLLPFTWAGEVDSQYADNQAASIAEVLHDNQCIYVYIIALHLGTAHDSYSNKEGKS